MAWLRSRRLRRVALVAIGGLLLNAATPLIADAAAALRGVPTGEICDVWGVPVAHAAMAMAHDGSAPMPAHEHAMSSADDAMAMPDHASMATDDGAMADDMAMPSDEPVAHDTHDHAGVTDADQATSPHEHSHSHGLHGACEHCALTAFATFAALDAFPAPLPPLPTEAHPGVRPFRADATPYDAVTSWVLHLKRGPPRAA